MNAYAQGIGSYGFGYGGGYARPQQQSYNTLSYANCSPSLEPCLPCQQPGHGQHVRRHRGITRYWQGASPSVPLARPPFFDGNSNSQPSLNDNQSSYLDQLQSKDQKLKAATERLKQMGFTQSPSGALSFKAVGQPDNSTSWARGNNGKTEVVYLSSDGTVTPTA